MLDIFLTFFIFKILINFRWGTSELIYIIETLLFINFSEHQIDTVQNLGTLQRSYFDET